MSMQMYRWEHLPWETIERQVFKLQKRIYQASQRGDVKTVHNLQRLLMKSWSAKCLAVRKVTQENQGKKTAGIDGVKSLTPTQRLILVRELKPEPEAKPVRRVWIPKPGKQEKRGLGIPVMYDRAHQGLIKLALEPEWEAKFEPNSYGFRPGRSCHDAIEAIRLTIRIQSKYALDADIAKCFDRINHKALLEKLQTFPTLRRVIKRWLKAGVMEGGTLFPTEEGTPQGGVVSPVLANIALHGLETYITSAYPPTKIKEGKKLSWRPTVIRYADDFLVLHRDVGVIKEAQQLAAEWLAGMGLELKPSKTRITHTLHMHEGNVGFDFLGFQIRQYPVGKRHTGKTGGKNNQPLGFKTIIKPSKEAMKRHLSKIKETIVNQQAKHQATLIAELNPVIRGWSNYHSRGNAHQAFASADHQMFKMLLRWAKRRHRNKPMKWIVKKYWRIQDKGKWDFAPRNGKRLSQHREKAIEEHIKVKESRSPFDGDWAYWATRMGKHPELSRKEATLLKRQQGRCTFCGLYFKDGDLWEIDHITPKVFGGKEDYKNLQLLHRHCHDQKTSRDGSAQVQGTQDKSQTVEEPCEAKGSRTDLKTSREGDQPA